MEEKKETQSSRLLQEQAEYHYRLAQRKVRNVPMAEINMRVNLYLKRLIKCIDHTSVFHVSLSWVL